MTDKLLPCPFCGGDAEQDYQRAFRHLSGGRLDHGAAIYCTSCNADMIMCRADHPELSDEERMAVMVENWNRCAAPAPVSRAVAQKSPPLGQASQVEVKRHERPEQGGMEGALAALAQDRSILDEGASRCNCAQATSRQPVPIAAPSSPEGGT